MYKILALFLAKYVSAQAPQPAENKCKGTLTKIENDILKQDIKFNDQVPLSANIGTGWKSFFATSDDLNCQVNKCTLMAYLCTEKYEGSKIAITPSYPWQITAMTYDKMGYTENFCLFCQIGEEHIYKEIQVTQESKCAPHLKVANKDR